MPIYWRAVYMNIALLSDVRALDDSDKSIDELDWVDEGILALGSPWSSKSYFDRV